MNKLDDLLKEFEEKSKEAVSSNRGLWDGSEDDEIYNVDIHIWRKTGMGNSLQTIAGNKVSIMTATTSYLQTLLDKDVLTVDEVKNMVKFAIKGHKGELRCEHSRRDKRNS